MLSVSDLVGDEPGGDWGLRVCVSAFEDRSLGDQVFEGLVERDVALFWSLDLVRLF